MDGPMLPSIALLLGACTKDPPPPSPPDALTQALADAFRIDLSHIDLTLDVTPDGPLQGHAELTFSMRPGQDHALFHFDPPLKRGEARDTLSAVRIDGLSLDPDSDDDLRLVQVDETAQPAFEIARALDPDRQHTLEIDWALEEGYLGMRPRWFQTLVDDTVGWGNERLWPTINSPDALARHTITVRVHDPDPYLLIGSGLVTALPDEGQAQVWRIETDRAVSSYTVMLAAMPVSGVSVRAFEAGGLPITLVSTEDGQTNTRAATAIEQTLARLQGDFGPPPIQSLQILLLDWDDGMEYYGATTTGLSSLPHELVHLYFGTSAVGRTWRDTWMDEAIAVWWEARDQTPAMPDAFHSDIVSGWPLLQPGFDTRAYNQGTVIMGEIAERLGGKEAMIDFLADLHARRAFSPFTTEDLIEDLVDATSDDALREEMNLWLYTP